MSRDRELNVSLKHSVTPEFLSSADDRVFPDSFLSRIASSLVKAK